MRVNGYQCDACCTVKNGENSLKDWFAVYDFRKGVESDEQHFCSLKCLIEWTQKQLLVVGEVKSMSEMFPDAYEIINPPHLSATEFKVTKEDCEFWRDKA
jgi:pyridoxine/pyridoxamine 5'-phosphate oxidase